MNFKKNFTMISFHEFSFSLIFILMIIALNKTLVYLLFHLINIGEREG